MKTFLSVLALSVCALTSSVLAEDRSLPFPVKLGGQTATPGVPFAKIAEPVSSDAEIEVGTKGAMTIINAVPASAKGEPVQGAPTAIILLQGTNKGSLAKTMDGAKLKPGPHLMSVVADGNTASILFQVK